MRLNPVRERRLASWHTPYPVLLQFNPNILWHCSILRRTFYERNRCKSLTTTGFPLLSTHSILIIP